MRQSRGSREAIARQSQGSREAIARQSQGNREAIARKSRVIRLGQGGLTVKQQLGDVCTPHGRVKREEHLRANEVGDELVVSWHHRRHDRRQRAPRGVVHEHGDAVRRQCDLEAAVWAHDEGGRVGTVAAKGSTVASRVDN